MDAKRKEAREAEHAMRQKAGTIGNIVNKGVPVSQTEVCYSTFPHITRTLTTSPIQDDNVALKTWHPDGPNAQVEKKTDIMAHHEVLLRLDAMDLERGALSRPISPISLHNLLQEPKSPVTVATSSRMMASTSIRHSSRTGSTFCASEDTKKFNPHS